MALCWLSNTVTRIKKNTISCIECTHQVSTWENETNKQKSPKVPLWNLSPRIKVRPCKREKQNKTKQVFYKEGRIRLVSVCPLVTLDTRTTKVLRKNSFNFWHAWNRAKKWINSIWNRKINVFRKIFLKKLIITHFTRLRKSK